MVQEIKAPVYVINVDTHHLQHVAHAMRKGVLNVEQEWDVKVNGLYHSIGEDHIDNNIKIKDTSRNSNPYRPPL